ncbi:MAG: DUF3575 domain-containing protein [Gemmatimonadales bacterium]|nr:DUF3575 domain-containing protein [Gemmatimonadales bacterium]
MNRALVLLALLLLLPAAAPGAQTFVKLNGLTSLIGVPGAGVEFTLSERLTYQVDATASFWRSVDRVPMQFLIVTSEWRYHLRPGQTGLYLGAHVGATGFRLQKWEYRGTDLYQEGFGVLLGGTVGYKRGLGERWSIDVFAGGGTAQSLYKGYHAETGFRYDIGPGWNKSGEWLPYRGGVMFARRIR